MSTVYVAKSEFCRQEGEGWFNPFSVCSLLEDYRPECDAGYFYGYRKHMKSKEVCEFSEFWEMSFKQYLLVMDEHRLYCLDWIVKNVKREPGSIYCKMEGADCYFRHDSYMVPRNWAKLMESQKHAREMLSKLFSKWAQND